MLSVSSPPPLPPGWSEHIGPSGQVYYYNSTTQESTYTRPLPVIPFLPNVLHPPAKKKDKPLKKIQVPGTEWIRVTTIQGNVFYSHKAKKESVWTVPEEIRAAVEALEADETKRRAQSIGEGSALEREQAVEVERVKAEVEEIVKRKAEDEAALDSAKISKRAKLEVESDEESEEEDWQREAAAQLAAEAEEEKRIANEAIQRQAEEAEAEAKRSKESAQLPIPERVDLSIEEAKALFKTLLREKDINPLHPWDTSLPLFVSDPRYVLLPSVSVRRETFDEYCRERARELRQINIKSQKAAANPKEEFELLLNEDVKSTRTSWSDWRKRWKKDRRFWGWGRDDREREKRFREFIKELGEKKRAAAQKAEAGFFSLLKESGQCNADSTWKDVKRRISTDPRYDAVGSSSLREELFETYLKANQNAVTGSTSRAIDSDNGAATQVDQHVRTAADKERAVKAREEKVRAERNRVEADIERSRVGLNKEEGERQFRTLLTDAIRDPKMSWERSLPQLKLDPRFLNSPLPLNQQLHLFHVHGEQLRYKQLNALHILYKKHSPSLATPFSALPIPSILSSPAVTNLGLNIETLELEYDKWQRERKTEAKKSFDEMLGENSFVEFWGRLGKIGGEGVEGGVKADELGEDEGEGGGGTVDMKALAKNVDVREIEKVLKNDRRYIEFDHIPEQREQWIRDYLSNLSAPGFSVHVGKQ